MASRHWDFLVWQQASELIEQAERIQRNFLQVVAGRQYHGLHGRDATWAPPVNVVETNEACWVISALPGVEPDQLEIRLEGNELVIAGKRVFPACCREGELKIWEIPLGPFERRLTLTPGIRFTVAESRFENGLFILQLKKVL
jgi:HSP20 family molecular chaperone IbpA